MASAMSDLFTVSFVAASLALRISVRGRHHPTMDCNGAWQPCGRLLFDCCRRFPRTIRSLALGNHGTPSMATSKPMRATSRPSGSLPAA